MTFWIIVLLVAFVVTAPIIGVVTFRKRLKRTNEIYTFAVQYREAFIKFVNSIENKADHNTLTWLVLNADKIQEEMGGVGMMAYHDRINGLHYSRYAIVLNEIKNLSNDYRRGFVDHSGINSVDVALLRHIGINEEDLKNQKRDLENPLKWFSEGIRQLSAIPLYILQLFGILGSNTVGKIVSSAIFKFFSGVAFLVAFISGIVTIIQGYDQTKSFVIKHSHIAFDTVKASADTTKKQIKSSSDTKIKIDTMMADSIKKVSK